MNGLSVSLGRKLWCHPTFSQNFDFRAQTLPPNLSKFTPQNATNCMFSESTCLKTKFGTYLEFLVPAVAKKPLGKVDQCGSFFAFPAIHAFTKTAITFDMLNRFYWMIAYFKGKPTSFKLYLLKFKNLHRLKFLSGWNLPKFKS